jgi:hypothetical protein
MTSQSSDTRILAAGINLLADVTTARVVRGLRADGLDSILLKGRAHRGWIDDDPGRYSGDVDLLVAPGDVPRAEGVLAGLGFVRQGSLDALPGDRPYHASNWATRESVEIDLHNHIVGIGAPAHAAWPILLAATENIEVMGEQVAVLGAEARALHVALHAAQHGVGVDRTIRDLDRAIEILPPALWNDAAALAERLDAVAAFSVGLRLTARGRLLAEEFGLPDDAPLDVALWASSPPPMTAGFEWLSTIDNPARKAVFVARKIVPPPEWMRAWQPLARQGRLGLAAAYVWRPLWLATHAPRAYRAWRRLRRERPH